MSLIDPPAPQNFRASVARRIDSARRQAQSLFVSSTRPSSDSAWTNTDPSFGHHGQHALHELGVLVDAARLQQVLHLDGQLMYGRVARGQLSQREPELQSLLEVG